MPKEKIESAVKRGQGVSASGGTLEPVQVECIGPGSVALIVFVLHYFICGNSLSDQMLTFRHGTANA
jgi:hypothetical protein